jgi:hypothetical protein
VFQIQLSPTQEAVPLSRDYIFEFERARSREMEAAAAD